ncbi:MAG: excinuclease ABC subunit UvrC [Firmicutes bacterium]|nr:excinuclease ABC subunit UvrC [Bacillota bacterium]
MFDIKEELKKLPHQPGVYIMKEDDTILYVGKAINLHNRVRQYFQSSRGKTPKILKMVSRVKEFEYIVTSTETEALVLENNLIKLHRPPYNTMLKDDKQYPYIKATIQEEFPRIFSTRKVRRDGAKYFGPYTNAGAVRETLELMSQIFCLRTCHRNLPKDIGKERPCLNYHIHRCVGPCTGQISKEEYNQTVKVALDFLEGKHKDVVKNLEKQMMDAAEVMDFERAAVLRDQIRNIQALQDRQIIENADSQEDRDVIAYASAETQTLVQAFFIRNGKLIGREHFFLDGGYEENGGEIIRAFIGQFYSGTPYIPKELLVVAEPEDREALEKWLSEKSGHRVHIKVPQRGEKYSLLELARKNAQLTLNQFGTRMKQEEKRTQGAMEELAELLGIMDEEMPPTRIEAYDISNTYGFLSVGSMVVFENGRPLKNDYRKFRIKTVYGANDYASLQEVLRRRFEHAFTELKERQEEGKDISLGKFTHLPDLILMDGGKGQVHIAEEVLREFDLEIPVAGMVKDDRHRTRGLYFQEREVDLSGHDEVFHLVTRIQDEAHRFAITYHKKLRSDEQLQSVLEQIPGIGPARRKALIAAFGSVDAIKDKEEAELAEVEGMNAPSARAVYEFFHQNGSNS